jgi:hypothetical protein
LGSNIALATMFIRNVVEIFHVLAMVTSVLVGKDHIILDFAGLYEGRDHLTMVS